MDKTNWKAVNRYEKAYATALKTVMRQMFTAIGNTEDPYTIVRRLKLMSQQGAFKDYCESITYTMVTSMNKQIKGSWRKAAMENGRGRDFYNAIMQELNSPTIGAVITAQTRLNADYIITLPQDIYKEITHFIQLETFRGTRASDIAKYIQTIFPEKTMAKAALIARTEVSKTQCALTKARAENLGLNWYIWRTSQDARVRNSHEFMEGVLIRWRDPQTRRG